MPSLTYPDNPNRASRGRVVHMLPAAHPYRFVVSQFDHTARPDVPLFVFRMRNVHHKTPFKVISVDAIYPKDSTDGIDRAAYHTALARSVPVVCHTFHDAGRVPGSEPALDRAAVQYDKDQ